MTSNIVNIKQWLSDNMQFLQPPVCNKLIYNHQLKVFAVCGPNDRKDYHLNESEELFIMLKGSMDLKIFFKDLHEIITINEHEIFLLPGKIPHSPQRYSNTIGLVIERLRKSDEMDCLMYFDEIVKNSIIYEHWFHCEDLEDQLKSIIRECEQKYFLHLNYNTYANNRPFNIDTTRNIDKPVNLDNLLNIMDINNFKEFKALFSQVEYKSIVSLYPPGSYNITCENYEILLIQWINNSDIIIDDDKVMKLTKGDMIIIKYNQNILLRCDGYILFVCMND